MKNPATKGGPVTGFFTALHGVGLRRDDRLVWNPHRDVIPVRLRLRGLAPGLSPDPYRDAVARHLRALGEVRDDLVRLSLRSSEERRVGKECVSPCRSRWWPYH